MVEVKNDLFIYDELYLFICEHLFKKLEEENFSLIKLFLPFDWLIDWALRFVSILVAVNRNFFHSIFPSHCVLVQCNFLLRLQILKKKKEEEISLFLIL